MILGQRKRRCMNASQARPLAITQKSSTRRSRMRDQLLGAGRSCMTSQRSAISGQSGQRLAVSHQPSDISFRFILRRSKLDVRSSMFFVPSAISRRLLFGSRPSSLRRSKFNVRSNNSSRHELRKSTRMKSWLSASCSFSRFVACSEFSSSKLLAAKSTTSRQEFSLCTLSCFSWLAPLTTKHTTSFSGFIFRHSYKRKSPLHPKPAAHS